MNCRHCENNLQHVLEPLSGYITLAELLYEHDDDFADAWNFGPEDIDTRSVQWLVEYLCKKNPSSKWKCDAEPHLHEANTLKLDSSKAKSKLKWQPRWVLDKALDMTLDWHNAWKRKEDMLKISMQQIVNYEESKKYDN